MNGEMMEYMVDRRGIPIDVLTRMKIEERLEFLPQTGKEEACICFPYLEDGVMKNMKFRDAAKHFKMVKGAELIPWNIDAIKGKEKCYITEGEIDALSLIAAGLEEVVSVPNGAGGANLQWLDRFVESHFDDKAEIILAMDTDKRGVELRDELVVTRNFAASLFRNIKYFTLRKLYLCRKWMQKSLQKTTTTGITLPNFDFLA